MNDHEVTKHVSPLFDRFRYEQASATKPPLLAHYTSIATAEAILRKAEIWMSNPTQMNDYEEVSFGQIYARQLVNECNFLTFFTTKKRAALVKAAIDHFLARWMSETIDIYVFCLTAHDDSRREQDGLLSMWRGYGGNGTGAAIVFDASPLDRIENIPLFLAKISYASKGDRVDMLKNALYDWCRLIRDINPEDDYIATYCAHLSELLILCALTSKHQSFSEEQEWRLISYPSYDRKAFLTKYRDYHVSSRGIETKLKLPLTLPDLPGGDIDMNDLIHSIVLGPSHNSEHARRSFLRMLDLISRSKIKSRVRASSIPYRAG